MEDVISEGQLQNALERDEFFLQYQPEVELVTGKVTSVEALVRWQHPTLGLIAPQHFIPLAETTGFILPLGEWVMNTACKQLKLWHRLGLNDTRMAVNLSSAQLRTDDLIAIIAKALKNTGLDGNFLELEVSESDTMTDPDRNMDMFNQLRKLNAQISIDNFGTGFSNLGYLKRLPINEVKIDRSFISDVTCDPDNASIARSVINLAHNMNLRVIAEGVETEAQLAFLYANGCNAIQGFLFSKPLKNDDMEQLLWKDRRLDMHKLRHSDKQRSLLIVDDEHNVVTSLRRLLRRDGYKVYIANSAQEGLDLLANHQVGVIISDQRMPEMNGSEFLSIVKELHPNTVRIIISGFADMETLSEAVNQGAIYKFFAKPWDEDSLRTNILEAFKYHELRKENERLRAQIENASIH